MIAKERLKNTLLTLLSINSPSGQEEGLANYLRERMFSLGFEVYEDSAGRAIGKEQGNLICKKKGRGPFLLFNAHMDTIADTRDLKIVEEGKILRGIGASILGGDDKAGITAILCAVEAVLEKGGDHNSLEIVFTISEEVGLEGAKYLDYSLLESKIGFVLDGGSPQEVIVSAPSHDLLRFLVRGKSAHAGVNPEEGINAIRLASKAIANMRLGRIDEETTANIGVIKGGSARNIVPDTVEILGEARSRDEEKLRQQVEHMIKCFEVVKEEGGDVVWEVERSYNMFRLSPSSLPVQLVLQAGQEIGLDIQLRDGGGGSDANIFNEKGIQSVILGAGAHKPHSPEEFVDLEELEASARMLANIMRKSL